MKSKILKSINKDINKSIKPDKTNKLSNICIEEEICESLIESTNDYEPKVLFDKIHKFIGDKNRYNRVLLSIIISKLNLLQDDQKSSLLFMNLDELKNYSESIEDAEYNDSKKFVTKLYDYIHLFSFQNREVEKFFDDQIKDAKVDLNEEVKAMQNQFIVILGIFASFIVTFVGGLSFSSSVLNGISSISPYRLFAVILLLGFVLMTICFSLYWFIAKVINKDDVTGLKSIYKKFVIAIAILLVVCGLLWYFGVAENRNKRINRVERTESTLISTYSDIVNYK